MEPSKLIPSVVKRADQLLNTTPSTEVIICSLFETLPEKRTKLSQIIAKQIDLADPDLFESNLPTLFKALRLLKTSNVALCNSYWTKVMNDIRADPSNALKTIRHTHRYMHFNNNLGGTYRHRELEQEIMKFLINEFEVGLSALIPSQFARSISFILAYGGTMFKEDLMTDFIVEKLEAMSPQLNSYDCFRISRGIQIAHELRYRYYIPTKEAPHLLRIEDILNSCAERQIRSPGLTIKELNLILKAFSARKSSRKSVLFQQIITKYDNLQVELNSRIIRDITLNLITCNYRHTKLFEKFIDYTIHNKDYVVGETLEKIITCFFGVGYNPENEEFNKVTSEMIQRDFEYMSGLSILQSCLSLCFFKALPDDLIHKVFNINFIKRLEMEIEGCYSKETYPGRVLNHVMQLNRAVCLDVPEANVPWFQQNYIEAQMSKG